LTRRSLNGVVENQITFGFIFLCEHITCTLEGKNNESFSEVTYPSIENAVDNGVSEGYL
jgi:hypothetical protein